MRESARTAGKAHRTIAKLTIALDLVKRARARKLDYGWVGADSFYGRDRGFQQTLEAMGEVFMVDVPVDFHVYLHDPRPYLPPAPARGRAPTRLQGRRKSVEARQWAKRRPKKAWRCYTYRNGTKGPMTVEALHRRVWVWDGQSEQAYRRHLVIRRDADGETKFSLCNAKARTSVHRLLYMQGQRHKLNAVSKIAKANSVSINTKPEIGTRGIITWH